MADSLADKMERLKIEHSEEEHSKIAEYHENNSVSDATFILGRIKQNDHLAHAIASNLCAQTIRALERFQQEKRHEALGFTTFDQFLNESGYSPMTKRQYYDRLALVRGQGDEIYDLLTSIGISVRSQRMLGTGDLSIKNDTLYMGDKEIAEVANTGIIKDVLNELFEEKRTLQNEAAKLNTKLAQNQIVIDKGTAEINELQRNLDAINEGTSFERALMGVVSAMVTLVSEINDLDPDERDQRAEADLKTLAEQYFQARDAYAVNIPLSPRLTTDPRQPPAGEPLTTDHRPPTTATDFDAKLEAALNEPDELDSEEVLD